MILYGVIWREELVQFGNGEKVAWSTLDTWLDTYINCRILIVVLGTCQSGYGGETLSDGDNPCPRIIYTSTQETLVGGAFSPAFIRSLGVESKIANKYLRWKLQKK